LLSTRHWHWEMFFFVFVQNLLNRNLQVPDGLLYCCVLLHSFFYFCSLFALSGATVVVNMLVSYLFDLLETFYDQCTEWLKCKKCFGVSLSAWRPFQPVCSALSIVWSSLVEMCQIQPWLQSTTFGWKTFLFLKWCASFTKCMIMYRDTWKLSGKDGQPA